MPVSGDADDHLYGLDPAEFTAARNAAVKAAKVAGDKEGATSLAALRRPTTTAWLVNLLVRAEPEMVEEFLGLGALLREAQTQMDGQELKTLDRERRRTVEALADRARTLGEDAGTDIREATLEEIRATLGSALAAPDNETAVRQGRLTTALSYSGMGSVAQPQTEPRSAATHRGPRAPAASAKPDRSSSRERESAREAQAKRHSEQERQRNVLADARQALARAKRVLDDATEVSAKAVAAREDDAATVADLTRRLAKAKAVLAASEKQASAANEAVDVAQQSVTATAGREAEAAKALSEDGPS